MEQLSDNYSHQSTNLMVKFFSALSSKVIVLLFCVLLMAFPIYSTLSKRDLVCFMQTNCEMEVWDCQKLAEQYSSLDISNDTDDYGRTMQRVVLNRTGKRFKLYISRNRN